MTKTNAVSSNIDLEKFRLRTFVDRLIDMGEVEIHDEPVPLTALGEIIERTPKAVLFKNAGPERAELVAKTAGSRLRHSSSVWSASGSHGNVHGPCGIDEVLHDEHVAGDLHVLHDLELEFEAIAQLGGDHRIAFRQACAGEMGQEFVGVGKGVRNRELRMMELAEFDGDVALRLERRGGLVVAAEVILDFEAATADVARLESDATR